MITMASTIKYMLSDNKEEIIMADYLQSLIKMDALENRIDMMTYTDEMYDELNEELELLKKYRDVCLKKLIMLNVDIDDKIKKLTNEYNDLYRY